MPDLNSFSTTNPFFNNNQTDPSPKQQVDMTNESTTATGSAPSTGSAPANRAPANGSAPMDIDVHQSILDPQVSVLSETYRNDLIKKKLPSIYIKQGTRLWRDLKKNHISQRDVMYSNIKTRSRYIKEKMAVKRVGGRIDILDMEIAEKCVERSSLAIEKEVMTDNMTSLQQQMKAEEEDDDTYQEKVKKRKEAEAEEAKAREEKRQKKKNRSNKVALDKLNTPIKGEY